MDKFVPVKITDKEWADKLLQGEIFMRPLHDFGVWKNQDKNKVKDISLNNNFRGDIHEGTVSVTTDIEHCEALKGMDPRAKKYIKQVSFVDAYEAQYMKIYSLYCLEYNPEIDFFNKPDRRMKQFGDTAVVIRDFDTFLRRIGKTLIDEYGDVFLFMMDQVQFYNFSETRRTNPIFEKSQAYAYQNELRLAFGELEENHFAINVKDGTPLRLIWDLKPKIINIGNISDIAYELPINEFLDLKGMKKWSYRWSKGDGKQKTFYELIVDDTRKTMSDFYTPITTALMTIW